MNVELICVGSELLSGDIVNTNASYILKELQKLGHTAQHQSCVDDNKERLGGVIAESLKRCKLLIISGGLGPTDDDITKETVCETLGIKLEENSFCRNHLENHFKGLGKTPTENNYKQAMAPENSRIFINEKGTACGICIEKDGNTIIMLPGPPKELTHMFETQVVPYLKNLSSSAISAHTLNVFGMGESEIETIIKPYCGKDNPVVATYCSNNECSIKITATADTQAEAYALCSKTMLGIKELLGDVVYGADSPGLASEVVNSLRAAGMKISTAESCTGGMLSQTLTSISHSSDVVEIGILAYSNRIKHEALSVPRDVLEETGGISSETAMYLAKNVRILSDSDIGVGITGNAGPTASENKPVGLVYVAIADKTKYFIKKLELPSTYDRERIRNYATLTALDLVRRYLLARPFPLPGMMSFDSDFYFEDQPRPEVKPENTEPPKAFDPNVNFVVFESEDYDLEEDAEPKKEKPEKKNKKKTLKKQTDEAVSDGLENKKNINDIIIKIISIICIIGLLISSGVLIANFLFENKQRTIIEDARENFSFENQEIVKETKQYTEFVEPKEENPDIRGWIYIADTNIDNPVYQAKDNDYYLSHNMNKESSRHGALFFDCNNIISAESSSKNLTVFGHNMRDKSMFGTLEYYRQLNFYKKNPIIKLKTLYQQNNYAIFAVMITNASAKDDNGYVYNFTRGEFSSDEDFLGWIAQAKERSIINTGIEVQADDEILSLSTCCYDFDNARFVVMAKKLLQDESIPEGVNATLNSDVKYPQAWYDKNGRK